MSQALPGRLERIEPVLNMILAAAAETAKAARKTYRATRKKRRNTRLRAGPDTPLWNELAVACEKQLTRYGEKAKLARILNLPRQRVHVLLVAKTACPDAERALQLVHWLSSRRRGVDLA